MTRHFNTAGPCLPQMHYMLSPMERLPQVRGIIDAGGYFVIHAPRQVGKTTALVALARELIAEGQYVAALVSMEVGAPFADHPGAAELACLNAWRMTLQFDLPSDLQPPPWPDTAEGARLGTALAAWAEAVAPRRLVLFLDEIDALRGDALLSVLRQLRNGYRSRPSRFPWSLALVGLRDVRDYRIPGAHTDHLGTASPFNIKVESITMRNFTQGEVAALYAQHTAETGQPFLPETVERAFAITGGQPWLVNALARRLVEEVVPDRGRAITAAAAERAKEILIERQDTHLDSLADRLRDPRIRAIVEPMLAGTTPAALPPDDIRFAIDLGLVRFSDTGGLEITNPIYREIVVRELAFSSRAAGGRSVAVVRA